MSRETTFNTPILGSYVVEVFTRTLAHEAGEWVKSHTGRLNAGAAERERKTQVSALYADGKENAKDLVRVRDTGSSMVGVSERQESE